jgi:hypothetical protein
MEVWFRVLREYQVKDMARTAIDHLFLCVKNTRDFITLPQNYNQLAVGNASF